MLERGGIEGFGLGGEADVKRLIEKVKSTYCKRIVYENDDFSMGRG